MAMYKIATAIPLVLLGRLIVKILWLPSEAALQGGVILLNDTRLIHNLGEFGCNQTIVMGENVRTNWLFLSPCWCFKLLVFNTDAVLCRRGSAALGP